MYDVKVIFLSSNNFKRIYILLKTFQNFEQILFVFKIIFVEIRFMYAFKYDVFAPMGRF